MKRGVTYTAVADSIEWESLTMTVDDGTLDEAGIEDGDEFELDFRRVKMLSPRVRVRVTARVGNRLLVEPARTVGE